MVRNFSFLTLYCAFWHKSATVLVTCRPQIISNYFFVKTLLKKKFLAFQCHKPHINTYFSFQMVNIFVYFTYFRHPKIIFISNWLWVYLVNFLPKIFPLIFFLKILKIRVAYACFRSKLCLLEQR